MTEIEKMYENAKIFCLHPSGFCKHIGATCEICERHKYPPFTAEKQLNIFKMFCNRYLEISQHVEENGDLCFGIKTTVSDYIVAFDKDFAECLACFVNNYWSSLTEQEKEEIRRILNE